MSTTPQNIAKKVGFIQLQTEYIKTWKNEIRIQRQIDIHFAPELASVYRSDANDLLSLATQLNKNGTIKNAQLAIDGLDTNVRELVPNVAWDLIFNK